MNKTISSISEVEGNKTSIKLYNQRAISIATFVGGPIAAGILIRRNFINLEKESYGNYSLILGVLSMILIFIGIFSIPENIIDKIPNVLIPAIYTGIIYLIVERYQGNDLQTHKSNNAPFYSIWRAIGISVLFLVLFFISGFGYSFLSENNFDTEKYNRGLEKLQNNEEQALQLFSLLESAEKEEIIDFIDNIGIPNWQENTIILDGLDKIEGLEESFIEQNKTLRKYNGFQIELYLLTKKAVMEETDAYNSQIEQINIKVEELFKNF